MEFDLQPEGEFRGTLGVDGNGCVTLTVGEEAALLWAPHGSELIEGGTAIMLPADGIVRLGSRVDVAGKWGTEYQPSGGNTPAAWKRCVSGSQALVAMVVSMSPTD